jgi:iron complex outermembrane recepter protein
MCVGFLSLIEAQMPRVQSFAAGLLVTLLCFGSFTRPVSAQERTGTVSGVTRTVEGASVPGVEVVVDSTGRSTRSASDGEFQISGVPAGTHTIIARDIGFAPLSKQITVTAGRNTRLEVALSRTTVSLGAIKVLGVRAYGASTSSAGLKTNARVLDVPQSVVSISHEFIQDQNAYTLTDLFRNVAGITPFSDYQDFMARGFREGEDAVMTDGVRSNGNNFFTTPNLNNVESVEILKGPSSVLYGAVEGGALINMVTKHPRTTPARILSVTAGSYSDYSAAADLTGPLAENDHLLYRLNANVGDVGSYRRFQSTRNWGVAPSLSWVPGKRTTLTLLGEATEEYHHGQRNRGIAAPNGDLDALPLSWTANEPTDFAKQNAYSGSLEVVEQLFSDWKLTSTARYAYSDYINKYHEPLGMTTVNGRLVMRREYRDQSFSWKSTGATANVGGSAKLGPIDNNVLLDADVTAKKRLTSPNDYADNVPPLDVLDPQYGQVDLASYVGAAPVNNPFTRDYRDWGLGAQDIVTLIPQIKVVVGGRYADYYVKNANYNLNTYDKQDNSSTTYKVGLVLQPQPWVSFYGDYNQGFLPQTAADLKQGGPFPPTATRQSEGGVKLGLFNERLVATSDVYRITKTNVLVPDPDSVGGNYLIPLGQVASRGFETDIVGSVTPAWSMTANYAYNDTKISQDTRPTQVGKKFPGAPRSTASFWTRYDFPVRIGLAAGAKYVDKRSTFDTTILPAYTVFDGAAYYTWERYQLALNVKNLLDKRYFQGGYFNYELYPGDPREVQLTVRTRF